MKRQIEHGVCMVCGHVTDNCECPYVPSAALAAKEKDARHLFTPRRSRRSRERLHLHISASDHALIGRGEPWAATVTDLDSGERYVVEGADCGSPHCFCDAIVVKRVRTEAK